MEQKLMILAGFSALCFALYWLAIRSTPKRGWLLVCERMFVGVCVIYLLNLCLTPFGAQIQQSPLSSLAAGCLGFPGAALAFVVQQLP